MGTLRSAGTSASLPISRLVAVVALLLLPARAVGFVSLEDMFRPVIAGRRLQCVAANGQVVAFVSNVFLQDVGQSRPGLPPTIQLNPIVLDKLPRALQLFWYGHECAHHVLGHTIGMYDLGSEQDADCWAIQTGRDQGLLSRDDVEGFEPYFRMNPGSPFGHLPGPMRAANFLRCYGQDDPAARRPTPGPRTLPRYCCTSVGRLGPYPNPGLPPGAPCRGTHPVFGYAMGMVCD